MKLEVIALVMALVMVWGVIALGEQSATAAVTVNQLISITIATCSGGLSFGSLDPGLNNQPITCQNDGTGAVNITNDAVSNVNINVSVKGTDFSGGPIAISNVEFDESNAKPSPITLTTSYNTSSSNVAPGSSAGVWYWLDIPGGTTAGSYTSTFSFKGTKYP